MPVPSQRQPRHPHSLSQFTGPRRFELTAQETFDFYRLRLKLIRQHLHGIAPPGKARLQVIKVRMPLPKKRTRAITGGTLAAVLSDSHILVTDRYDRGYFASLGPRVVYSSD